MAPRYLIRDKNERFTTRKWDPCTQWLRGWLGFNVDLQVVAGNRNTVVNIQSNCNSQRKKLLNYWKKILIEKS